MRKSFLTAISVLITTVLFSFNVQSVSAAGSPLQISPLNGNSNYPCGIFYNATHTFTYNGGTVWLSSMFTGNGDIYTDDKIDIIVTRSDNTTQTYSRNYGNGFTIVPTVPQNVTYLFKPGDNTVNVKMTDLNAPICNSSQYWLVENSSGGGGNSAPRPTILSRSSWNGGTSSEPIVSHSPNRVAIHHTNTSNDPGNLGTYARELLIAARVMPYNFIFNPTSLLNPLGNGNYSDIRGTWAGEIWLIRAAHLYFDDDGFDDIGYQYLIDPVGNIYEGTYKGGLAESAAVRGSNVYHANTNLVGVAFLGRYGADGAENPLKVSFDGAINHPTNASIQSAKSLIDWLASRYGFSKTGMTQLPASVDGIPSCTLSPDLCYVNNISGHKDYGPKTGFATSCPGDNLYGYLSTLRGSTSQNGTGSISPRKSPKGILVGGFSPIELGVVDPSGNRLGIDPTTGQSSTGITDGVYGKLDLFEVEEASSDSPYWLHIPTPQSGVYKIDVVGTGNGGFKLAAEDLETSSAMGMQGSVTTGSKDNYQIIYSTANPSQIELFHDNVPPVTTGKMTCSRDMLGICRSDATINLTATDTGSNGDRASGVAKIECSHDNKATWQHCGTATGGQFVISNNGKTSFWYRSTDRVLNVEEAKFSGIIDVQKYVSIADTIFKTDFATTLKTTGVIQSNGNASFGYNTTVNLDTLQYIGTFSQTGNTTFTIKQNKKVTTPIAVPNYPLSYYKTRCTNYTGTMTINDTSPVYNKCIYVIGDVNFNATTPTGKLTIVSEGYIRDKSTTATLGAWDTQNGVMFYSAKGYSTEANKAKYTGVIYAPTTQIIGSFSNTTFNGGMYSKTVGFGSGTSLTAIQAAGFPATTHNLPL